MTSPEVQLMRTVCAQPWLFVANVCQPIAAPEHMPILLMARDTPRLVTPTGVARHLFGRDQAAFGARLIAGSVTLGLLAEAVEGGHALTESGQRALADGEVLLPEYALWKAWIVRDQLLPWAIVDIQREKRSDGRGLRSEPIPEELRRAIGVRLHLPASRRPVRIDLAGAPEHAIALEPRELQLTVRAAAGQVTSLLENPVRGGAVIEVPVPAGLTHDAVWREVQCSGDAPSWTAGGWFGVEPESLEGGVLVSRRCDVSAPPVAHAEWGRFGDVKVVAAPVGPATESAAARWTDLFVQRRLAEQYLTRHAFAMLTDELIRTFAPHFKPQAPDQARLASTMRSNCGETGLTVTYWHAQAPLDWEL